MGHGSFSNTTYRSTTQAKMQRSGTAFEHNKAIHDGTKKPEAAPLLDPKRTNNNGPHTDQIVREAYDNDDHPTSTPVAVFFDVTGSMGHMPVELQQKLPNLFDLLAAKGYIPDVQILFGATADEDDPVPLQVSQFEADNTASEHLENIYIYGGGGRSSGTGYPEEAYNLAMYFMADYTDLDSLNKRDKKGYLFFLADEAVRADLPVSVVRKTMGDTPSIEDDLKTSDIVSRLLDKYEVFVLFCEHGAPYNIAGAGQTWIEYFGADRVIPLAETGSVCEVIAGLIAMQEGKTASEVMEDLKDVCEDEQTCEAAGRVLAGVGSQDEGIERV